MDPSIGNFEINFIHFAAGFDALLTMVMILVFGANHSHPSSKHNSTSTFFVARNKNMQETLAQPMLY